VQYSKTLEVKLAKVYNKDHSGGRGAEKARLENAAPNCRVGKRETGKGGTELQGWKMRDWKTRHETAGVEDARLE